MWPKKDFTCRRRPAWLVLIAVGLAACSVSAGSTTSSLPPRQTTVYSFGVVAAPRAVSQLDHTTPFSVVGIPGTVVQVATSNSDSYALTSSGVVWAWGSDEEGELGNGSIEDFSASPERVQFPSGVRISLLSNPMPYNAAMAIDSDGTAWGWGFNAGHDLCLQGFGPVRRPQRLPVTSVSLVTGAGTHALFDSYGHVYACGTGLKGQLGDGTSRTRMTPTAVVGLPSGGIKALTSSWQGSGALMDNGAYYDWGYNAAGQLGDGTTRNRAIPVRVHLHGRVVTVSQGGSTAYNGQSLAVLANGSLWMWGDGEWGQIGNGSRQNSTLPTRVDLPDGATPARVIAGGSSCYVIDTAGRLWVWGRNEQGQLGLDGQSSMELKPVSVGIALTQLSATATNVAGLYTA